MSDFDQQAVRAIDALGKSPGDALANRTAVEDMLEAVAKGHFGVEQRCFCTALAVALLTAAYEPTQKRRDAIVRATGLAGANIAHLPFVEFVKALAPVRRSDGGWDGFDGMTLDYAIAFARQQGKLASDPAADDYLDEQEIMRLLRRNGIEWPAELYRQHKK